MAKRTEDGKIADELFKGAPRHARELLKSSRQEKRKIQRAQWWAENKDKVKP